MIHLESLNVPIKETKIYQSGHKSKTKYAVDFNRLLVIVL